MAAILHDIGQAYESGVIDTGRQPELLMLLAFLLSFGFIRTSTHLIRSQRFPWWPGNVQMGSTHVHHLVWGILLLIAIGYASIAFRPASPAREILAVLFGVGMGLTLDEFALWLNLKDVYWSKEGRQSIDAVVVAAGMGALVLLGIRIWIDLASGVETALRLSAAGAGTLAVLLALVNMMKGKPAAALAGLAVPVIGLVAAVRLARPRSPWARVLYREGKRARSLNRFGSARPSGPRTGDRPPDTA